MLQLMMKTLLRALFIFIPVVYLSFRKEAITPRTNDIMSVSIDLIVLIFFIITIVLIAWARKRALK